jgi:hypothetical protein
LLVTDKREAANRQERGSKLLEGKTEALSPLPKAGQEKSPSDHSDGYVGPVTYLKAAGKLCIP